jgi:hypothetical protein
MSEYSFMKPVKPKRNWLGLVLTVVSVLIIAVVIIVFFSKPTATETILPGETDDMLVAPDNTAEMFVITLSDKTGNEYDSLMRQGTDLNYINNITGSPESSTGSIYSVEKVEGESFLTLVSEAFNVSGEKHIKEYETYNEVWIGGIVEGEWIDYNQKSVSIFTDKNGYASSWAYNKGYGDIDTSIDFDAQYDVNTAVSEVKTIMSSLGYNEEDYNIIISNDFYVKIKVEFLLEGEPSALSADFLFDGGGLQSASGNRGVLENRGTFPLITAGEAVKRLGKSEYSTFTAASVFNKYFTGNIEAYEYPEYSEQMFMYYGHSDIVDENVIISKYETGWVSLTDVNGNTFIVKGYLLVSEQGANIIYATPAIVDEMINIVGNSVMVSE